MAMEASFFLLFISSLLISCSGSLVGFSYHERGDTWKSFLQPSKVSSSQIRVFVTDHRILSTLTNSNMLVDLYLSKSQVENFITSKPSATSELKAQLVNFLPRSNIKSIIVSCGSECLLQNEIPLIMNALESIYSILRDLHISNEVKLSVAFPLQFLTKMNPSQEHEIRKLLSFIKETELFVTLEDTIDGELSMEDHFVQTVIKRAALAASVLPCNDVPVVLTIKSSVIPSSVELAEFSRRVSEYLAARRPIAKRIAALYLELHTTEDFSMKELKREEEKENFPSSRREILSKLHRRKTLDGTNSPTTFPLSPFLRHMPPPTADSSDIRRYTPEETNGFHNGNAESSKPKANSAPPPIPSTFRDAFIVVPPEILRRIVFSSAKGFSVGAGIKGGLALFAILARFARKKPPRKEIVVTNGEVIVSALKETLRYGLFLGTFAGTFVSMDEFIGAFGGHRRTARWRALFAGAVAGQSMLLTGLEAQHTSLAIYILMRAAVLASRCGIKSKRFGRICKPLTWKHGDIFLMCLSSSQILSAYILYQDSLPASYKSFLNKHGGKDAAILQGVKDIASGKPFTNLHAIKKYYKTTGVDVKLDPNMKVPCSIVHGNQSCGGHVVSFLGQAYKRALPVYFPVYLIPALIVHRKGLLKRPFTILTKVLIGTARSSLFLSVYCTSAWMWTCFLFRIFKRCNIPMVAMGTFPPGLGLAIEKKSRRMEISLYCLARAIESFFTCIADAGYLPQSRRIKRADVVVFSLSTAIIMHCYAQEREVFRSKYLNVLDWVFGVPPPPCETPRCKDT